MILEKLPMTFLKWWTTNVGSVELTSDSILISTGMKSDLEIKHDGNGYIAVMRYHQTAIETFHDLHRELVDCKCGRDYMRAELSSVLENGFGSDLQYEDFN